MRVEKDFSFSSRAYAGDRWVLVGRRRDRFSIRCSRPASRSRSSRASKAAQAVDAGSRGDLSAAPFRRFARRQRRRYRSFRRFVSRFYTPEFRDCSSRTDPPRRMFASLVTVFAGYWRPSV